MTARDDLIFYLKEDWYVPWREWANERVENLLDAYAHELAEKQRAHTPANATHTHDVIDLIDPEVSK